MPTQTINFANVSSASYNGTSLSEIKLNSTSIWQSKFSTTMTVGSKSYQHCGSKDCSTETMYGYQGSFAASSWNGYLLHPTADVISMQFPGGFGSMGATSGGVMTNSPILGIAWTDPNSNGGRVSMWYMADHFPNSVHPSSNLPIHSFSTTSNSNLTAGNLQTLKIGNTSLNLQSVTRAITYTYGTWSDANQYFTKQANAPDMTYVDWDVSGNPFPSVGNTVTIEVT